MISVMDDCVMIWAQYHDVSGIIIHAPREVVDVVSVYYLGPI